MAYARREAKKNRLLETFKDVGGIPAIFSAVVGALSLLSLLEIVTDYRLSAAFQWIVDDYHWITAVMALAVEPLVAPLIAWINVRASWHLVLYSHWRPLFVLAMIFGMGLGRAELREAKDSDSTWRARLIFVIFPICILVGSLIAGLVPIEGRWWEQGVLAVAPFSAFYVGGAVKEGVAFNSRVGAIMMACGPIYISAACLSFIPGFERSAGIAVLAGVVVSMGLLILISGFKHRADRRTGFSMLGGFFTAGIIVGADQLVR